NLSMLQRALKRVIPGETLDACLAKFEGHYQRHYETRMLAKLGFDSLPEALGADIVAATLDLLESVQVGYHTFFLELARQFSPQWRSQPDQMFNTTLQASDAAAQGALKAWRQQYHHCLQALPETAMAAVGDRLRATNPETVLLRPEIEAIWEPITVEDDWQPFYDLLKRVQQPFLA
ncbi:MAG: protein adenylyltransferase SelO family protein, partial [Cyanobacteria bacterium]|nr:protein adenylyltransferase SelO family protein [Cyanobacteriota bacterium]